MKTEVRIFRALPEEQSLWKNRDFMMNLIKQMRLHPTLYYI